MHTMYVICILNLYKRIREKYHQMQRTSDEDFTSTPLQQYEQTSEQTLSLFPLKTKTLLVCFV